MALKKPIDSEKYLYAKVLQVVYEKNLARSVYILIQTKKTETDEVVHNDNISFFPLQTEEESAVFSLENQNALNNNVIACGYVWLKTFKPLFFGWEDA